MSLAAALAGPLEQGLAFGVMVLGVYLSFRVLNVPDLTVDGSFPLGGAVAAALLVAGVHPALATLAALAAGAIAGLATGLLATRGGIAPLLAGILTMTALYSINLRVMGRANVSLLNQRTLVSAVEDWAPAGSPSVSLAFGLLAAGLAALLFWFLLTEAGSALRATGDNEEMVRSLGVDVDGMKLLGLALANGLVALSGALVAQYQGFADAGMGIGTIVAGLAAVIIGEVLLGGTGGASSAAPSRPAASGAAAAVGRGLAAALAGSVVYRLVIFAALRAGFAPTDLKLMTAGLVVLALSAPRLKKALRLAA